MRVCQNAINSVLIVGLVIFLPQDAVAQSQGRGSAPPQVDQNASNGKGGPDCREIADIVRARKSILSNMTSNTNASNSLDLVLRDQRLTLALLEIDVASSESNCAEIIAKIEAKFSPH